MPILAEADRVIASEAINAALIRTIRLMQGPPGRWIAMSDKFPSSFLFHGGLPELPNCP
jgi:hypothetical protein